jgi:predicted metal-dependent peptidase
MNTTFDSLVSSCRLRLRMNSPFFATLALFTPTIPSEAVQTAATDGRAIYVNPGYLASLSMKEIDGLLLHEILHAALLHVSRRGPRNPERWNVAADIVVNGILAELSYLKIPAGGIRDPKLEPRSVEEIYELLPDARATLKPNQRDLQPQLATQGASEKAAAGTPSDASESALAAESVRARLAGDPDTDLEAYWSNAMLQASIVKRSQQHGTLPAALERLVQEIAAPQLDWRTLLWRFLVQTPNDFSGYDRRFVSRGLYLDAMDGESFYVDACIDTSGSIDQTQVDAFISELRGILNSYPHIDCRLFYADSECYGPYTIERASRLPTPEGGGGTDFRPFFEKSDKDERLHRKSCRVAVYLTDGYGEFPDHAPLTPTLWVVSAGGLPAERFPFGEVATLLVLPSSTVGDPIVT